MNNFDIGIIGGGPAGYTYALHASAQGKSVVLFEKDKIGGVCLNKGCIPTKSILHSSEVYKQTLNGEKFGVTAQNITLDYSKVIERKNKTVETLRKGIELALKNAKVTVIHGEAQIQDKNTISLKPSPKIQAFDTNLKPNLNPLPEVEGIYHCSKIVCSTGSSPKIIKGLEFDHEFLLSSDDFHPANLYPCFVGVSVGKVMFVPLILLKLLLFTFTFTFILPVSVSGGVPVAPSKLKFTSTCF